CGEHGYRESPQRRLGYSCRGFGARCSFRISVSSFEFDAHICNRMPSKLGILVKTTAKHFSNSRVERRGQQTEVWFALEYKCEHVRYFLALKCLPAREHFVEHATKGKDVGTLICRATACLLGRHVGSRS